MSVEYAVRLSAATHRLPDKRLKLARVAAGYPTAKSFADQIGVPQPTYSLHEAGKRRMSVDVAQKYAAALGNCDAEWLLMGSGRGPVPNASALQASMLPGPMRGNPMRARLDAGEAVYGTMAFEFFTPGLMAALQATGADFVLLDTEHSGVGIETIKAQVAAARGLDIVPMVRVPGCHYHLIAPVLDAGAMGIMVPMVETAEQARQIASWCRYPPDGVRGSAFGMAHDDYSAGDVVEKMRIANERTLVIALVETARGIENIDAIMAVDGIDIGWLGHFDLTASMGIPGQFEHPDFLRAIDALVAACARNRKPAGFLAGSVEMARVWREKGFRAIAYNTDIGLLQDSLRGALSRLRAGKG